MFEPLEFNKEFFKCNTDIILMYMILFFDHKPFWYWFFCLFGCAGSVYFLDDRGKCSKCFQIEGSVKYLLYYERNDIVVTISESLLLTQHGTRQDAAYSELSKVIVAIPYTKWDLYCLVWF